MTTIAQNYEKLTCQIKKICEDLSLSSQPKLLPVTKGQSLKAIEQLYQLGCRDFAENKAQELMQKWQSLPKDIKWHFIGNLQSNKVAQVVRCVKFIHSVSSLKLLYRINRLAGEQKKIISLFLQVNISGESSKGGFIKRELKNVIGEIRSCSHIKVLGFMTMTRKGSCKQERLAIFCQCKAMANDFGLEQTSMGMSSDYKQALEAGASYVRIGRLLFV